MIARAAYVLSLMCLLLGCAGSAPHTEHGSAVDKKSEAPIAEATKHQTEPAAVTRDSTEPVKSSNDSGPRYPHENGTLLGTLIPAGFIGGASLISCAIFFLMREKPHQS